MEFTFKPANQNDTCGDDNNDEFTFVNKKYSKATNDIPFFFPKGEKTKVIEAKQGSELKIECGDSIYIGKYDATGKLSNNWIV
jgi:hypothetical protein